MKPDWWTLGLQTVNVLILLWVLQRFLFKPVLAVIARRQQQAQAQGAAALKAKADADGERAALAAERQTLSGAREQAMAAAQAEAQQARAALLAQAGAELAQQRAAAALALEQERQRAAAALRGRAAALAGDIARQLLQRLPAASWNGLFVDGACRQLGALTPEQRALLRQGDPADVDVVSADALDGADRASVQAALDAALGGPCSVRYALEPALIAGVELRLRHLVVRNHWAGDLDLLTTLAQHEQPAEPA